MLSVNEFIQAQQAAVNLAIEKGISYEDAVRTIAAAKEQEQMMRRKAEAELLSSMVHSCFDAYETLAPIVSRIKTDISD